MLTWAQKRYVDKYYKGRGNQELADMVNAKFGTCLTKKHIKTYKTNHKLNSGLTGHFEKGIVPFNKGKKMTKEQYDTCKRTMFKKGNVPVNHKPVGSTRIDSKDGYIIIKTAEPHTWRMKQRVVWEKYRGPLTSNDAIVFLDGNKLNCKISNLVKVSRAELARLNQNNLLHKNSELSKTGVMLAKLMTAIGTKRRKIK